MLESLGSLIIEAAWAFVFAFSDSVFWRDTITTVLVVVGLGYLAQRRIADFQAKQATVAAERDKQEELYREVHELWVELQTAVLLLERAEQPTSPAHLARELRREVDDRLTGVALTATRILTVHELAFGFSTDVFAQGVQIAATIAGSGPAQERRAEALLPAEEAAQSIIATLRGLMSTPVRFAKPRDRSREQS